MASRKIFRHFLRAKCFMFTYTNNLVTYGLSVISVSEKEHGETSGLPVLRRLCVRFGYVLLNDKPSHPIFFS